LPRAAVAAVEVDSAVDVAADVVVAVSAEAVA